MLKAGREAREHSSWVNPDADYEEGTRDFIRALLTPASGNPFLQDFLPFQGLVARLGALGSLSRLLLRLTAPGVPDFYQGSELWDFSLVDPDNRRPVDFQLRQAALDEVRELHAAQGAAACARELLGRLPDGRIKLYLVWQTLGFRRLREALFRDGDYLPLKLHGPRAEQALAFARHLRGQVLVVVVSRLLHGLAGEDGRPPVGAPAWADTWVELPPERMRGGWVNLLTDEPVSARALDEGGALDLAELFRSVPFALLTA